jgi:hypothetical protein
MSQLEAIKHEFHNLIDDETVLTRYFGTISSEVKGEIANSWGDISAEEQAEILEAYEESKDPANLISHEEVMRNYDKWLTK